MDFFMRGNYAVYNAGHKVYTEDAAKMREEFKKMFDKGQKFFAVDFSTTDYIDSTGLGVLVGIHKKVLEMGGTLKLVGVKGNVRDIFELTRLTKVFQIYHTIQEI